MQICSKKSFTIMEIIVVIVIVGAIAGFAIPSYTKTLERAFVQDAMSNLQALHAANQIRRARTAMYWPEDATGNPNDVNAINMNLSLNIIENGMIYTCDGIDGTAFTCMADRNGGPAAFTVTVTELNLDATNPGCTGACP